MIHTEIVELLLSYGATADMMSIGMSALTMAVKIGNTEIIRLLIKHGAQVDLMVGGGLSALIMAVDARQTAKVSRIWFLSPLTAH